MEAELSHLAGDGAVEVGSGPCPGGHLDYRKKLEAKLLRRSHRCVRKVAREYILVEVPQRN